MEHDDAAGRGRRALLVMPASVARALTRHTLAERGYALEEVTTVAAAMARVAARPPDVVLLDPYLEAARGPALLRQAVLRDIPVVLMGSHADAPTMLEARALGGLGPAGHQPLAPLDDWLDYVEFRSVLAG